MRSVAMGDGPVCAILTPGGRGAVATVGVRGGGAVAAVGRRFCAAGGPSLDLFAVGRVVFGRFRTAIGAEEELVVGLVGGDEADVHCHGGSAAVEAVCEALVAEGCRRVDAAEWVHIERDDPVAAAAMLALAHARTERTAGVLLDQHRGALRAAIVGIERELSAGNSGAGTSKLKELLARGEMGMHLTEPWRIMLAGRPNAGKSSLMNAIVGYERAIVFEQPGTTRDVLSAGTAIDGWPVELADTAGIRPAGDSVEAEGVARARREVATAEAVVLIADTTAAWDAELHAELVQQARRLIVVHNKCDLRRPLDDGRPVGIEVSAKTGAGIDSICQALTELLVPDPPQPGEAVPFTAGQIAVLRTAAERLRRGEIAAAQAALQTLGTDQCGL
jgi:tRNA modification GTPase